MTTHAGSRVVTLLALWTLPLVAACSAAPAPPPAVQVGDATAGAAPGAEAVASSGAPQQGEYGVPRQGVPGTSHPVADPARTAAVPPRHVSPPPGSGGQVDRDADGLPDATDHCPDEPEDQDGFQDDDGCPDIDNDNDGVPDVNDLCPSIPETKNGFQDADGCPDQKP